MVYTFLTGRIGNNLFQIATAPALAERNNAAVTAIITKTWCHEPDNCYLEDYLKKFENDLLMDWSLNVIQKAKEEQKTYVEEEFSISRWVSAGAYCYGRFI